MIEIICRRVDQFSARFHASDKDFITRSKSLKQIIIEDQQVLHNISVHYMIVEDLSDHDIYRNCPIAIAEIYNGLSVLKVRACSTERLMSSMTTCS